MSLAYNNYSGRFGCCYNLLRLMKIFKGVLDVIGISDVTYCYWHANQRTIGWCNRNLLFNVLNIQITKTMLINKYLPILIKKERKKITINALMKVLWKGVSLGVQNERENHYRHNFLRSFFGSLFWQPVNNWFTFIEYRHHVALMDF